MAFVLLAAWAALGQDAGPASLESRLAAIPKTGLGKTAIAVKHLGAGESLYINADEPLPTASLIKFPVMIEAYQQVAEGKLKMNQPVTLRKADRVPGSGVLTNLISDDVTLPLIDVIRLMSVVSDNTATNLVLDQIGMDATAKRMAAWGHPETQIHSKVYRRKDTTISPERSERFGLGSTTARDMVQLLEKLHGGKLVSPEACKEMVEIMKKCDDDWKFPRFLPPEVSVAQKTGSVSDARTAAGILAWKKGPVALCVLTAANTDKSFKPDNAGDLYCARVAKEVFDYFNAKHLSENGVKTPKITGPDPIFGLGPSPAPTRNPRREID
jgi:beta-lactamase class A